MEKRRINFAAMLTVTLFCFLQSANLFAQSTHFFVSPATSKVSLTHTVFRGSNSHYSTAPFFREEANSTGVVLSTVGRGDQVPGSWKYSIVATVFWVGEQATEGNPIPNTESAWDVSWVDHYGGEDSPIQRSNFIPIGFTPRQNPFYVALPYNDVDDHHTRPEAARVIPWFKDSFVRDGQSVCKGHWVAIRHGKRTCYAQWEDVGPFQIDHWQYVFGNERPRSNRNDDAGLDVSPAVRDYLGMSGMDVCDWKFVNVYAVPDGPWALYGDNNTLAHLRSQTRIASTKKLTARHSSPE
jgi:hypothetical protein